MNYLKITDIGENRIRVSLQHEGTIYLLKHGITFRQPNVKEYCAIRRSIWLPEANNQDAERIAIYGESLFKSIFQEEVSDSDSFDFFKLLEENYFEIHVDSRSDDLSFLCIPWETLRAPSSSNGESPFKMLQGVYRQIISENILFYPRKGLDSILRVMLEISGPERKIFIPICREIFFVLKSCLNLIDLTNLFDIIAQKYKDKIYTHESYLFELYFILKSALVNETDIRIDNEDPLNCDLLELHKTWASRFDETTISNSVMLIRVDENDLLIDLNYKGDQFGKANHILQSLYDIYKINNFLREVQLDNIYIDIDPGSANDKDMRKRFYDYAVRLFESGNLAAAEGLQREIVNILDLYHSKDIEHCKPYEYYLLSLIILKRYRFDEAEFWLKKGLEIAEYLEDYQIVLRIYHTLGLIGRERSKLKDAILFINKFLDIARTFKETLLIAEAYHILGIIYLDMNKFEDATKSHLKALEIYKRRNLEQYVANEYYHLSLIASESQDIDNAEKWCNMSFKIFLGYHSKDLLFNIYHQFGNIARDRQQIGNSKKWHIKALEIAEASGQYCLVADEYHHIGILAQIQKNYDEAEEWHYASINIFKNLGLERYVADDYHELGVIATNQRRFEDAQYWHKRALNIFQRLGLEKNVALEYHQLGVVMGRCMDFEKSKYWHKESLNLFLKLELERNIASEYRKLGLIAEEQNLLDEAKSWHSKSLEINHKLKLKRYIANECHQLGIIARRKKEYVEAKGWHEDALKIFIEDEREIDIAGEYAQLGVVSEDAGEIGDASTFFKKALDIYTTQDQSGYVADITDILTHLGRISVISNKYEEAIEYYGLASINSIKRGISTKGIDNSLALILIKIGEEKFRNLWYKKFKCHESKLEDVLNIKKLLEAAQSNGIWIYDW